MQRKNKILELLEGLLLLLGGLNVIEFAGDGSAP